MNTKNMSSDWSDVTGGERNEIVFEGLNKKYGAYPIRTNYDRTLLLTLTWIFGAVLLLSAISFISDKSILPIPVPPTPPIHIDHPPFIIPPVTPPITPPVLPPAGPRTQALSTPLVVDSVQTIDSTEFKPVLVHNPNGNTNDTAGTAPTGPAVTGSKPLLPPIDSTFTGVFLDDQPEFPGGEKALFAFLRSNINYPRSVIDDGGFGTVGVEFVLDKEGNVTDVKLGKATVYPELNKEAMRVVKKMPKWNPGKQHGYPVRAKMILPIRFELKQ